jgi:SAM-dependent methyltransferase
VQPSSALNALVTQAQRDDLDDATGVTSALALASYGEHALAERVMRSVAAHVVAHGVRGKTLRHRAVVLAGLYAFQARVTPAAEAIGVVVDATLDEVVDHPGWPRPHALAALVALADAGTYVREPDRTSVSRQLRSTLAALNRRSRRWMRTLSAADIQALIAVGHQLLATRLLQPTPPQLLDEQLEWVCCAYRLGQHTRGERVLATFEEQASLSDLDDALLASSYLLANRWRVSAFFESIAAELPTDVGLSDGRAQAIIEHIRDGDRVVEVGCGKGRFLRAVTEAVPGATCIGVDLSPALLASVQAPIRPLSGTLEAIPCRSECFDVVFSVEAIEHSANWRACVQELLRITRPGGTAIIIDKPKAAWGWLPCPPWEWWPDDSDLLPAMREQCDDVTAVPVSFDDEPADGKIVAWRGRKRGGL